MSSSTSMCIPVLVIVPMELIFFYGSYFYPCLCWSSRAWTFQAVYIYILYTAYLLSGVHSRLKQTAIFDKSIGTNGWNETCKNVLGYSVCCLCFPKMSNEHTSDPSGPLPSLPISLYTDITSLTLMDKFSIFHTLPIWYSWTFRCKDVLNI